MKIFTTIGNILDETFDKIITSTSEAVDKAWKEGDSKIHVNSKKKVYNKFNDTTTIYTKYTKNGKTVEEFIVNGRKVDPDSKEAQKIRDSIYITSEPMDGLDKGFEAMDVGFKAMDKAFENMDKMFDKMFD